MLHYRNVYKKEKFRRAWFSSVCSIHVYTTWPECHRCVSRQASQQASKQPSSRQQAGRQAATATKPSSHQQASGQHIHNSTTTLRTTSTPMTTTTTIIVGAPWPLIHSHSHPLATSTHIHTAGGTPSTKHRAATAATKENTFPQNTLVPLCCVWMDGVLLFVVLDSNSFEMGMVELAQIVVHTRHQNHSNSILELYPAMPQQIHSTHTPHIYIYNHWFAHQNIREKLKGGERVVCIRTHSPPSEHRNGIFDGDIVHTKTATRSALVRRARIHQSKQYYEHSVKFVRVRYVQ